MLKVEPPSCRAARVAAMSQSYLFVTGPAFEMRLDAAATAIARAR